MTTLLKKAFDKAATLPEEDQELLANQLLEDIKGERAWERTLATPKSQKLLATLAEKARRAKRDGKTHRKGFDTL